jgi:hypothetical protein
MNEATPDDWSDDKVEEHAQRLFDAKLLASGLRFTANAQIALLNIMPAMVHDAAPIGSAEFRTNGGRKALVVVVVGDEDVEDFQDFISLGDDEE